MPLLQIEVVLSGREITLQPNASEIEKMTLQSIQDCVEITKVIFDKDLFLLPEFASDYNKLILFYVWVSINIKGEIHTALS